MQELTIKQKLTNYYYFVIFNSILACIIGVGYWLRRPVNFCIPMPKLTDWLDILYITTTHFVIITLIIFAISLTLLPTIYLKFKKATLIHFILYSILLAILVCDVRVFQCDQAHIFSIKFKHLINIMGYKQAIFTINKAIACIGLIVLLWIIYKIQQWIDKTNYLTNNKIATIFSISLLITSIISLFTYQLSTKEKQQQFLVYMQYLPLYNKHSIIKNMYEVVKNNKLQYPLKPLKATTIANPPNILIIGIDAWRADCFNKGDSPNLWQFAQNGKIFTNHFSGANHTFAGLFSLFYGIPAIYFNRFQQQKIPSLLFSRLQQLDYQIDSFTDNGNNEWLKFFTNIKNLNKLNNNITRVYQKDPMITQSWLNWHANLDKTKPWFAFVFYDSVHGLDFPESYSTIAKPSAELYYYKKYAKKYGKPNFITSYKTAVHYIDSLANKILQQLKDNNELDNTIVIITADHGCEWNDNNQGYYGCGSNFTNCQVQVPLAIVYPKNNHFAQLTIETKLTTHYDIAPTLMKNFLGINNNIADYSIGNDLTSDFNAPSEILVTACNARYVIKSCFAIIAENQIIKVNFNSSYNLIDKFNNLIFNKTINQDYLNQALEYMTRFIKK